MTEEDVLENKELWPFLPAIAVLKRRLLGIKDKYEILGFCIESQVHTEQEMLFSLVTQKVFAFDVKNSIDVSWDIRLESFSDFYTRSDNVLFTFKGFDRKKSKVLIDWIIELCNWNGGFLYNKNKH
jgi:hypothetical protein